MASADLQHLAAQLRLGIDLAVITCAVMGGLLWSKPDIYSARFFLTFCLSLVLIVHGQYPGSSWHRVDCGITLSNQLFPCYVRTALFHGGRGGSPHSSAVTGFAFFAGCMVAIVRRLFVSRGKDG